MNDTPAIVATMGKAICGLDRPSGRQAHDCAEKGCIQAAVGGGQCPHYRSAKAAIEACKGNPALVAEFVRLTGL